MKKRLSIPRLVEKRIFQEAESACVFCREAEIASLEVHHIDEDPSNNSEANLVLVCKSCHGKITAGVISQSDVSVQKRKAVFRALDAIRKPATIEVNVSGGHFRGDVAQTINKFSGKSSSKIQHPNGSIGANLKLRGYVDYLIARYYELKKADISYGSKKKFSHAVLHQSIHKKFGTKTFFTPEERFDELCEYLKFRIDETIQGKRNKAIGGRNYHSFENHPGIGA